MNKNALLTVAKIVLFINKRYSLWGVKSAQLYFILELLNFFYLKKPSV